MVPANKPPVARSAELAAEIVTVLAESPRSLGWLCKANPHWPSRAAIYNWKNEDPEFREAFNLARRDLADELAFQSLEIAADSSGDAKEIPRRDGSVYVIQDQEFTGRSKLKVSAWQWMAAKLAPDVYGDRVNIDARLGPILSQEEALKQLR